jgi:hypothetical protein
MSVPYQTIPGVIATGDLSSYQYYVVCAASTAGAVKVAVTAATDPILGVLQNDPASGEAALVAAQGVCWALAEASVTYGSKLTCSSTGRVKATTTDKDEIVGIALAASSAAGDMVPVLLSRFTLSQ